MADGGPYISPYVLDQLYHRGIITKEHYETLRPLTETPTVSPEATAERLNELGESAGKAATSQIQWEPSVVKKTDEPEQPQAVETNEVDLATGTRKPIKIGGGGNIYGSDGRLLRDINVYDPATAPQPDVSTTRRPTKTNLGQSPILVGRPFEPVTGPTEEAQRLKFAEQVQNAKRIEKLGHNIGMLEEENNKKREELRKLDKDEKDDEKAEALPTMVGKLTSAMLPGGRRMGVEQEPISTQIVDDWIAKMKTQMGRR